MPQLCILFHANYTILAKGHGPMAPLLNTPLPTAVVDRVAYLQSVPLFLSFDLLSLGLALLSEPYFQCKVQLKKNKRTQCESSARLARRGT